VKDHASTIAKDLQEVGAATRRMAADSVDTLRETATHYLDEGRARARVVGDTVQTRVQQQPIQALLVAAAVGFLFGALWSRR
jgi:ElaB/YqjD/DUF883 family membrane-anchored ribosome-binding protein